MSSITKSAADAGLLDRQLDYYRARAGEYDEWFLRRGRYDRGADANAQWFEEVETVRAALDALPTAPRVLELAAGTGLWTERLARRATSVHVVDGAVETLECNRQRLRAAGLLDRVAYECTDLFSWQPPERFDLVFFGFWISHVPESRCESFWRLVAQCLAPGGQFFLVDNLPSRKSKAIDHAPGKAGSVRETRRLNDGREFEIVKIFHAPAELEQSLSPLGWSSSFTTSGRFFLYGSGKRAQTRTGADSTESGV